MTTSIGYTRCRVEDVMATMLGALKRVKDTYAQANTYLQRVFDEAVEELDLAPYAKTNKNKNKKEVNF